MNSVVASPNIGLGEPVAGSPSIEVGQSLADRSAKGEPLLAGKSAPSAGAMVANSSDAGVAGGVVPRPINLPSRKTLVMSGAALIIVVTAAVFGYHWWTVGRFIESTDDAYVGGDITVIAPKVSGFISRVAVTDNQQVHAGDILVELDNRDYVAARARAVAAVAAQEAAITNLTATRHLQEAVIAQAQASINAADAEIDRSREDQVRYQRLEKLSAVSTQESQKADADYKNAIAAGARTRAALAAAQRQLDVIDSQSQLINSGWLITLGFEGADDLEIRHDTSEVRAWIIRTNCAALSWVVARGGKSVLHRSTEHVRIKMCLSGISP